MTSDAKLERALDRVRSARADYEARQDDVAEARDRYYEAVRSLNSTGMSLREVADALGLSHQRVHQMIHEPEPRGSKLSRGVRKASKAGGVVVLVGLLAANVMWLNARMGGGPDASPTPTRVASLDEPSPSDADEDDSGGSRACAGATKRMIRQTVRYLQARVWIDSDGGRPVRGINVDVHMRHPNQDLDFVYTVKPAGSGC